jgi:hypothetical protein
MRLLLILLCSLLRHPPATWGETKQEDILLRMIHTPVPGRGPVTVEMSCLCGRKMVPFRAQPLRKGRG